MSVINEEFDYWQAEADDAHRWLMLVHDVCRDMFRNRKDRGVDYDLLADLHRAQSIFRVQYLHAVQCAELALLGVPLNEALAA
jgi:hypothetical protein